MGIAEMLRGIITKATVKQRDSHRSSDGLPIVGLSQPVAPLPPTILVSPACPYCGVIQEPPPTRRRKCRGCDQLIYIGTDLLERKRYLLTKEEAELAECERRDARWKELSQQVKDAMQAGDWQALRMTYNELASILFAEGRPHNHIKQEAMKAALMGFQQVGIDRVQVLTCKDEKVCNGCNVLENTIFTVAEASELMPIPGLNCKDGEDMNPHGGRCRCLYIAVIL